MNNVKDNKEKIARYSDVLYDEAMLLEGFEIKDKEKFIKNLNELIIDSLK